MQIEGSVSKLKDFYKKTSGNHVLVWIYSIIFIFFILIFSISICLTHGVTFSNAFFGDKSDTFMDYFNSVMYSSDLPYTKYNVIYPALITVFYKIIGSITIPFDINTVGTSIALQMRNSQSALMIFGILTLTTIYFILLVLRKYFKKSDDLKVELLCVMLICSYPLVYGVERGNSIIYVFCALLFYVLFYNSENRILRYLSYVCLGIATGIKIYVVFFGLLILRERNYMEFAICYTIVLLLFFIPFIFTDGTVYTLLHNIFGYTGGASEESGSFHSIKDMLGYFSGLLDLNTRYYLQYLLISILYLCTFFIGIFGKSLELWKIILLLCSACVLGMGTGTTYNSCLYIIPFVIFLSNNYKPTKLNIIYVILFALMFIWIPAPFESAIDIVDVLHFLPAHILTVLILFEYVHTIMKHKDPIKVCSKNFTKKTNLKHVLITFIGVTIVILCTLIAPLFNEESTMTLNNTGQNSGRFIEEDEEFSFAYNSGSFVSEDGSYTWNQIVAEYLISTDCGFISVDTAGYYDSNGNMITADLPDSWSGVIKNKQVTLNYSDFSGDHSITWVYSKFAVTASPIGDLAIYSIGASSEKVFINTLDSIYGMTYNAKYDSLISIIGTSAYIKGENVGSVKYNIEDTYYNEVSLIKTSTKGSTVLINEGSLKTNIVEYIVPKTAFSNFYVTQEEIKITSAVSIGLTAICLLGCAILVFDEKLKKNRFVQSNY